MQSYSKNPYYNIFSLFLYFIKVSFSPFPPTSSYLPTLILKKKCKKNKNFSQNVCEYKN